MPNNINMVNIIDIPAFRHEFEDKILFEAYRQSRSGDFDDKASYLIRRENLLWQNGRYYCLATDIAMHVAMTGYSDPSGVTRLSEVLEGPDATTLIIEQTTPGVTTIDGCSIELSLIMSDGGNTVSLMPDTVTWHDDISANDTVWHPSQQAIQDILDGDFSDQTRPTYQNTWTYGTHAVDDGMTVDITVTFGEQDGGAWLFNKTHRFIVKVQPVSYMGWFDNDNNPRGINTPSNASFWDSDLTSSCITAILNPVGTFSEFMYTPLKEHVLSLQGISSVPHSMTLIKTVFAIPESVLSDATKHEITSIRDSNGFEYWTPGNTGAYIKSTGIKSINGFDYYIYILQAVTSVPSSFIQTIK